MLSSFIYRSSSRCILGYVVEVILLSSEFFFCFSRVKPSTSTHCTAWTTPSEYSDIVLQVFLINCICYLNVYVKRLLVTLWWFLVFGLELCGFSTRWYILTSLWIHSTRLILVVLLLQESAQVSQRYTNRAHNCVCVCVCGCLGVQQREWVKAAILTNQISVMAYITFWYSLCSLGTSSNMVPKLVPYIRYQTLKCCSRVLASHVGTM